MEKKEAFNPFAEDINKQLLDALCIWIGSNLDSNIGWTELVAQSNLSHTQLQYLFTRHKQTTPMTYIRKLREDSKKTVYTEKIKYAMLSATN
jgi:AraC-like DNA-binding protein